MAVQFHPEFKSKPRKPHPLFAGFVEALATSTRRRVARRGRSGAGNELTNQRVNIAPVAIGPLTLGPPAPAALHRRAVRHRERVARARSGRAIKAIAREVGVPYVFKASFDKANRTSITSFRGPGLDEGLRTLARVKSRARLPRPDRHPRAGAGRRRSPRSPTSCRSPRSCRGRPTCSSRRRRRASVVNVKKGQFLAPLDMRHPIAKVRESGNDRVFVTERGSTFGYHNLVVDMRAFPMIRSLGVPVVFDVTHSLQLPGAGDGVTAGQAEFIEPLASAGRRRRRRRRVHGSPRRSVAREERRRRTRCGSIASRPS